MKNSPKPHIELINVHTQNNGADGIRVKGDFRTYMQNVTSQGNGGSGINFIPTQIKKTSLFKTITIGMAVTVIGGLVLAYGFGIGK